MAAMSKGRRVASVSNRTSPDFVSKPEGNDFSVHSRRMIVAERHGFKGEEGTIRAIVGWLS